MPLATEHVLADHPSNEALNGTRDMHGMILVDMVDTSAAEAQITTLSGRESCTLLDYQDDRPRSIMPRKLDQVVGRGSSRLPPGGGGTRLQPLLVSPGFGL